ncbi:MAG TPA: hypothetical protein VFF64_27210 [Candidatus Eremiobacteraceae bacterium]|nr:hypothetical protein [Candidatus Eremiobacteraceae bacterium]
MSRLTKTSGWIAVVIGVALLTTILALIIWHRKPIFLRGAILVQDADPRKQLPIAHVAVSVSDDLALFPTTSDSSGLFVLELRKLIRRGHPIVLHFSDPQYRPLVLKDFVSDKLYIVHLVPVSSEPAPQGHPAVKVANVRVRYTVQALTELNVGSAAKTFEIQNKGDVPCKGQHPCSPDGRWKATLGSGSLDAGPGREFRDARVSCIAGPCPFTRIESDGFSKGGQNISFSVRDWSDATTFLLEAEVFRPMVSQTEHWSYPVVFGDSLSFTLPADAGSESIEADLDGQTIIFPLGPSLFLSWAACDSGAQKTTRVYRCALRPGYQFN